MPSPYATKLAEGFSARVMEYHYDRNLAEYLVNRDYEGEINGIGSILNILTLEKIEEKTYERTAMSPDNLYETNAVLAITELKSFYPQEKTIDKWESYIKDPSAKIFPQMARERMKNVDMFVLSHFPQVAAGNRIGTDVTGTLTGITDAGVVTSAGTEFTETMIGRGFKADGHTKWYRVKDYTSTSVIEIENDSDDEVSAYDGGEIGAVDFTVEAVTPIEITKDTLLSTLALVKQKLDNPGGIAGVDGVPDEGRWAVFPAEFETALFQATGIVLNVPAAYEELIKRGMMSYLLGLQCFRSNRLSGDNVDGYHILAGHSNWLTFADKVLEARIEEDLPGDFGTAFKDLFVYGAKVADSRRIYAAELFATFA